MDQKHYVIIGGTAGIGLGIVKRLVAEGQRVTVFSRQPGELEQTAGVEHVKLDVVHDEPSQAMFPDQIDGLAYCPGSINLKSFRRLTPEAFREDFDLNVVGAVKCIQAAMAGMKKVNHSSLLLFSTVAVGQGMFAHASIAASKGAIEGLTRTLAAELAPSIRVNAIAPALTETRMTEKFFADPEKAESLGEKYPLKRTGTVADLSAAAVFLLTDQSNWITGQVLGVDGGMSTARG